jgi:hypothetical protein
MASSLDELFAEWGITDDTVWTKPCCKVEQRVGDPGLSFDQTVCPHGCCVIHTCHFCGVAEGGHGPAGCPCACNDLGGPFCPGPPDQMKR